MVHIALWHWLKDDEGQRIRRESNITIDNGGVPRAEISPQAVDADVFWTTMPYDERFFTDSNNIGDLIQTLIFLILSHRHKSVCLMATCSYSV